MALGDRKRIILKAVVDDYIKTAEPVGSKTLARELGIGLSSATLRNEMSELEALGYLEQPHTSAGRIPSQRGYRVYVDELMDTRRLDTREAKEIERVLASKLSEIDRLISEAGRLVASMTRYTAYAGAIRADTVRLKRVEILPIDSRTCVIVAVFSANAVRNTVTTRPSDMSDEKLARLATVMNRHATELGADGFTVTVAVNISNESGAPLAFVAVVVDFLKGAAQSLDTSEVHVDGAMKILEHPEFRDMIKARKLLEYLSDGSALKMLPAPEETGIVKIIIGSENLREELSESSVVAASYDLGDGMRGLIGVVGPIRMDYPTVAARLGYFAEMLGRRKIDDTKHNK